MEENELEKLVGKRKASLRLNPFDIAERINDYSIMHPTKSIIAVIAAFAAIVYGVLAYDTRELNPVRQLEAINQQAREDERKKEQYKIEWNKLFDENGLADKNNNGVIEFYEQADAWRRMGYKKPYFETKETIRTERGIAVVPVERKVHETQFETPTLEDLERAIKSYEAEKNYIP